MGVELDVFNSQPNIKNLDDVPGIHLGVTNVGVNLLMRYPGQTFQPYAGIGGALLIARLSESATTRSDTDVGFGLNVLRACGHSSRPMWRSSPSTNTPMVP